MLALVLQSPPAISRRPLLVSLTPTPCAALFRVGFVTDSTGLDSTVDAQGWAGVQAAARAHPCLKAELIRSIRPTDYVGNLKTLAGRDNLVIAGSFLLTEAVTYAAREYPRVRFVLVDPLLVPAAQPNLAVVGFREDQAAFLAGALAAMLSHTRVLAGVYGLEGGTMTRYRRGFERGAAAIDPGILVLGAYQAAGDGPPFGNPAWGESQARHFLALEADVVFGAGGMTGQGALLAAAATNRLCVGAGNDDFVAYPPARPCLLTSAVTHVDLALETTVFEATIGRLPAGLRTFGVAEGGVGLAQFHAFDASVTPAMRTRLTDLRNQLAAGGLLEAN